MDATWLGPFAELVYWWFGHPEPEGMAFDAQWGTETRRFDLHNYEPSRPAVIDTVLDALDVELRDFTFVDLGSGKGRAVLIASQRPFAGVVGIEHRAGLHGTAQANLDAFRERGGPVAPVHFFHGDVATHPLPEGPLVLFLYNPFPADLVDRVLRRVEGRVTRIAYVLPMEHDTVSAHGFEIIAEGGQGWETWRVYRPSVR